MTGTLPQITDSDTRAIISKARTLGPWLLNSTIWCLPTHARIVWLTLVAMSDDRGIIDACLPAIAQRARVEIPEAVDALRLLADPDEYSRRPGHDGRKIVEIDCGWQIVFPHLSSRGEPPRERSSTDLAPWTYLIVQVDGEHMKIGLSSSPRSRLAELQVGSPFTLSIVLAIPGNFERELHAKFAGFRVRGEWFRRDAQTAVVEVMRFLAGDR